MVKSDVVERAAGAAQATSSMPNQKIDPRVTETDDGGTQRNDAELLHDSEMLELGVPNERTEHGVPVEEHNIPIEKHGIPVEDDAAVVIGVGLDQVGEGLDQDQNKRYEVHDYQNNDD